jgi:hypothetical protein
MKDFYKFPGSMFLMVISALALASAELLKGLAVLYVYLSSLYQTPWHAVMAMG